VFPGRRVFALAKFSAIGGEMDISLHTFPGDTCWRRVKRKLEITQSGSAGRA
jgi:hypothetical protein